MKKYYTDCQLVALLREDTEKGFAYIYDNYYSAFYNVTCKIVGNGQVASDLLQDAFIKIWKYSERFNPNRGTLFTWMLNITRNTAIDYYRAERAKGSSISLYLLTETDVDNIFASEFSSYQQSELRTFVNELPVKLSAVINAVYFDGHTMEEAAIILSVPLGTIKSRVRKALNELRAIYCERQVAAYAA